MSTYMQIMIASTICIVILNLFIQMWLKRLRKLTTELQDAVKDFQKVVDGLRRNMETYQILQTTHKSSPIQHTPNIPKDWLHKIDEQIEQNRKWEEMRQAALDADHPLRRNADKDN